MIRPFQANQWPGIYTYYILQLDLCRYNFFKNIFQVKSSRNLTSSKPPARGGPSKEKDDSDDETSNSGTVTTETTLVDVNVKEYQVLTAL